MKIPKSRRTWALAVWQAMAEDTTQTRTVSHKNWHNNDQRDENSSVSRNQQFHHHHHHEESLRVQLAGKAVHATQVSLT